MDRKSFANATGGPLVHHERYSPLIRTYSALRSQVQIVAPIAAAGAEVHVDPHVRVLQVLGRLRRGVVMRQAVLEQQDAADVHRGAIDVEDHARSARPRRRCVPSWGRRRARRS